MAALKVVDQNNKEVGSRELREDVFGLESDAGLVHRVYSALARAQRAGTHSTKTVGDVSGGGKKPFKQKGTGRARQGTTRAAQMRHGGTAHGPQPHDYNTRINKKERKRAVKVLLSDAVRDGRLIVLNKFELEAIKTKSFLSVRDALSVNSGLFVLAEANEKVQRSGRNVPNSKIVLDGQVNMHDIMKYNSLVLTEDALSNIEKRLGGE
ncbi:MAG: 50S ribosomal protein L4 [Mariprofundaceae bacterium]|nr:50S ribosomal protein L4 [Mariprofundaceae bacterium]